MGVLTLNAYQAPRLVYIAEHNLWGGVLVRAVFDACPDDIPLTDPVVIGDKRVNRRVARTWFRRRSREFGGWAWLAETLDLTDKFVRRIEDAVFERNPVDAELAVALQELSQVEFLN